jgi:riboflavin synthase
VRVRPLIYAGTVFTGLVREVGAVRSMDGGRLVVESSLDAELGDSIAVEGVCLTVVANGGGALAFDAVSETLARTTLGTLDQGSRVNLEPALRAGDALGGHYVQGHVDGVGEVRSVEHEGEGLRVWIEPPADLMRYIVEKGSITVHGVSLTVADLADDAFAVALIPHTLAATTLGTLAIGDRFNLEVDVLGKYVERMLASRIRSTS